LICLGEGGFGVYFDSGPTNHKHMLKIKVMLMTYTNSLRTYRCMLIGQDMLISNMLIARFYWKALAFPRKDGLVAHKTPTSS
jgi:hypothetical protein